MKCLLKIELTFYEKDLKFSVTHSQQIKHSRKTLQVGDLNQSFLFFHRLY